MSVPLEVHRDTACRVLSETPFFADLTVAQLHELAAIARVAEFAQDTTVYNIGQRAEDFYVLVDGMVRFTIGLGNRQASAGEILRRGELFGWAALVERAQTRIASSLCVTPCVALVINGNECLGLMDRDNTMGYRIMKQLNHLITSTLTAFAAG
jgi:CRP-like cAMP-binding protein